MNKGTRRKIRQWLRSLECGSHKVKTMGMGGPLADSARLISGLIPGRRLARERIEQEKASIVGLIEGAIGPLPEEAPDSQAVSRKRGLPRAKVLLVVVVLAAVSVGGWYMASQTQHAEVAGPEDTAIGYLEALAARKAWTAADYWVEDIRSQLMAEEIRPTIESFSRISITNLNSRIVSLTEDKATVEVKGDARIDSGGETYAERLETTFYLVRVDGRWLIKDYR